MAEIYDDKSDKKTTSAAPKKAAPAKEFVEEVITELKKTTWPTRPILTKSTTVVLALVLAVAVWVGGIDAILTRGMGLLFGH